MRRFERLRREIWNLPNMITVGRVFLIPPVVFLMDKTDPVKCLAASLIFVVASLLDAVDGWLARKQGLVTVFGKFVDPLADKIMVCVLLVYLVADGRAPAWMVVLLLSREFYIGGLRSLASVEGVVIPASSGGKLKTIIQLAGISFLLIHFSYRLPGTTFALDFHLVGIALVSASLFASVWSAINYTVSFGGALGQRQGE
ncbi:MAG: CDP-diacylglycerol--glycerol-3-phosphate 3-phosphatidyltransferase [Nannocystis sp.]|jgi:CDP-diacylglycerol--glycerol-3-phosphate 3-phosphatidyltransferase|nr:CDP-diacylglycerol--glycerol-3-phosphate 3-phosphatidyltransferase [Nannocystis sp.]